LILKMEAPSITETSINISEHPNVHQTYCAKFQTPTLTGFVPGYKKKMLSAICRILNE
jgi:hypothetical protein